MSDALPLSRRRFLQAGSAAAGVAAIGLPSAPAALTRTASRGKPTNLVFMVADGMSAGTLSLCDMYRRQFQGRPCNWSTASSQTGARRAAQTTYSADSLVTDSAAAAAAWSTGVKHNNGWICIDPAHRDLRPILLRAKDAGKAVGVVTTCTVTHATPAAFYANLPDRNDQARIASQLLSRRVDLALGGGAKYFPAIDIAAHPELRVVRNRAELLALKDTPAVANERLLGIFNDDHLSYTIDRAENEPTLTEMSLFALDRLAAKSNGFVLQIEGGRVDHAAHGNDACSLLRDMLAFDDALAVVAEWVRSRSDTLLVVTTDHGTANPGLTFYGHAGILSFSRLHDSSHSFDWIAARMAEANLGKNAQATAAELTRLIELATTVKLGREDQRALQRACQSEQADPFALRSSKLTSIMGDVLANTFGVAFISGEHSADITELFALGAGAESLPTWLDNTLVHDWCVDLLAIPRAT